MAYLTWLADVLRASGLPVREVTGWRTRGHGGFAGPSDGSGVRGVLAHHTAGPATGAYPSERIVVEGRAGLAGPLANLGLDRNGVWIVVAAGTAWHAGTGSAPWVPANQGNSHLIGVEAESVGTRDDWTSAQRESYPRGVAALLRHLRLGPERAIGHKEWAPSRKIDPAFWDMRAFRADVARWLATPSTAREGFLAMLNDQQQSDLLNMVSAIFAQLSGDEDLAGPGDGWGWPTLRHDGGPDLTVVDYARNIDREANSRLGLDQRPGPDVDTAFGHLLSLRAELRALRDDVTSRLAKLAQSGGLPAAVAGASPDLLVDLAKAVADEQDARQRRRLAA